MIVGVIGPAAVRIEKVVGVGPAVAPQVEDRLAGPVARELGLGAVGVEDPQLGDELGVLAAREQQHPVGADPEMGVAEPLRPAPRVSSQGSVVRLDDQVVVAERLPLLESHRRSLLAKRRRRRRNVARWNGRRRMGLA